MGFPRLTILITGAASGIGAARLEGSQVQRSTSF
jgi:NADP-dependent 3-hydroxy acid dehydrogenase YdfG